MVDLRQLEKDDKGRSIRPEDRGHKNPSLAMMNAAARRAEQERRDENEQIVGTVAGATRSALDARMVTRREQKDLRPKKF